MSTIESYGTSGSAPKGMRLKEVVKTLTPMRSMNA